MKRFKQLSFVDIKISSLIPPDDPLKILFESIDFSFIYDLVKDRYSREGREGYDPVSLFKAILLIYLGFADSERDLASKLRFDGRLSFLCGFSYGETPKHNTFHYFRERLGSELFQEILLNLIAQAIALIKARSLRLSIDSSHLSAFKSDKDARWGVKSANFFFFGYKVHVEVTNTEFPIPVSLKVSSGNEWDGNFLPLLTEEALKLICRMGKSITEVIGDAGYDSAENAGYLMEKDITPIIAENPRGRKNAVVRGEIIEAGDGRFLCRGGKELLYWGRERKRKRIKFRCPLWKEKGSGCLFREECFKGGYGPTFYLKEDEGVADVLKAIRKNASFKSLYKTRTAVERFFSILKGSHFLEEVRFRGIKGVSIHVIMSICAYLIRVIASMKLNMDLISV